MPNLESDSKWEKQVGLPLVKTSVQAGIDSVCVGWGRELRKEGPSKPNISSSLGSGIAPFQGLS